MKMVDYLYKKIIISSPTKRAEFLKKKGHIKMGNNCQVFDNVSFGSEPYLIELGDNVRITKGVNFITHDGGVWVLRNNGLLKNADIFGRIKIGHNVHIGINAVIMPGVTIGDNVIVGVGAIVTKDVPPNSVVAGIPAKVIKSIDEYFEKNKTIVDFTKHMSPSEKKTYLLEKYSN
ncbi:acyltransferase [Priestia megaterium]|uniref:acyltransferase n=1 Tax=Priestia megaterium TaxID=1404 RepID=UPI0030B975F0